MKNIYHQIQEKSGQWTLERTWDIAATGSEIKPSTVRKQVSLPLIIQVQDKQEELNIQRELNNPSATSIKI